MKILHARLLLAGFAAIAVVWASPAAAQGAAQAAAQSSSRVSAEMVKGKLNPATSKPGDEVAVRLSEDLKQNGEVVLKKGTTITGVVRSVKQVDASTQSKGESKAQSSAQSMIQLEWLAPATSGAASQQLSLALQSIAYTNPLYAHQQQQESAEFLAPRAPAPSRGAPSPTGGGLLSGAGGIAAGVTSSAGAIGQAEAGLLATPSLITAGPQTASASKDLVMVGHGQATSSGGTVSSMDIFSQMSNDSVITSSSKDFEISSGAQMQFLVSARGRQ